MENKQLPKSTIKLENVKVKFLKKYEWGTTFNISIKAYNKDKNAEARYDNYSCIVAGEEQLEDNDIVTIVGRFQTEMYKDKLQLKVNVTKIEIIEKAVIKQEIDVSDLPF